MNSKFMNWGFKLSEIAKKILNNTRVRNFQKEIERFVKRYRVYKESVVLNYLRKLLNILKRSGNQHAYRLT